MAGGEETEHESKPCPTAFLGRTGLRVSRICLGTMTFGRTVGGRPTQATQEEANGILDAFVEFGGNFIDTADKYGGGQSEGIIGEWLEAREEKDRGFRERLVIATKLGTEQRPGDVNSGGLSRKHVLRGVEQSLERLKTSYVDILYCHIWDCGTPVDETIEALSDVVKSGKVMYVGFSNVTGYQLAELVLKSREKGIGVIGVQQQYSLLCRGPVEWETQAACKHFAISLLPWSPLKGGWLTAKALKDEDHSAASSPPPSSTSSSTPASSLHAPAGSRIAFAEESGHRSESTCGLELGCETDVVGVLEGLREIGKEVGASPAQVALQWLLAQPCVDSIVIGATSIEQLRENMAAASLSPLSLHHIHKLTTLSQPPTPYPYRMIKKFENGRGREGMGLGV